MEQLPASPRLWLEREYLTRRRQNPRYSMRAFASLLDLPSGRVSQLLSAKRRFTPKLGKKIAERLGYDPNRARRVLELIEQSRKPHISIESEEIGSEAGALVLLDMDQFESIADPLHFSILSLLETEGASGDPAFIARRLRVSRVEARTALERLLRLGLVRYEGERLVLTHASGVTTSHDIRSTALRLSHKKVLQEACDSLDDIAVELRDITSMTMAIDPLKLPQAKEKIREFRRGLSKFLESGRKSEVYRINIQLIPVSSRRKK